MTTVAPPSTVDPTADLRDALAQPGVTDVLVNGPDDVWWDRGAGLERAPVRFADAAAVRQVAVRLASLGGRRLDDAQPVVDARLPDGSRLHAVLDGVASGCAVLSLRRVRWGSMGVDDLQAAGTVSPGQRALIAQLVADRRSVIVSGATGSGKTTLLGAMLSLAPPTDRLVLIEEAGELAPDHPHVVRLIERLPNVDGAGAVPLARLVREALRMRPDRVVLGECRGAELREVLTALNTGHRGGMTTLHANAAADVPARLVALGALAGMDGRTVALHAATAFDAVVHLDRHAGGRSVSDICRLVRDGDGLRVEPW